MVSGIEIVHQIAWDALVVILDIVIPDDARCEFQKWRRIVHHVRDESYYERIISQRQLKRNVFINISYDF